MNYLKKIRLLITNASFLAYVSITSTQKTFPQDFLEIPEEVRPEYYMQSDMNLPVYASSTEETFLQDFPENLKEMFFRYL